MPQQIESELYAYILKLGYYFEHGADYAAAEEFHEIFCLQRSFCNIERDSDVNTPSRAEATLIFRQPAPVVAEFPLIHRLAETIA